MPKLDGTGPRGLGQKTGRGLGSCCCGIGWDDNDFRGRRFLSEEERKKVLEDEAKCLREDLAVIEKELADMK